MTTRNFYILSGKVSLALVFLGLQADNVAMAAIWTGMTFLDFGMAIATWNE